jgi:CO/xanthine dehydrogenase Mo-binding subunit
VENADGPVPHGSKGIGGSGLMPTVSAMAWAIGVRLTELPLAPKRVWQAMRVARDTLPPCEAEAA